MINIPHTASTLMDPGRIWVSWEAEIIVYAYSIFYLTLLGVLPAYRALWVSLLPLGVSSASNQNLLRGSFVSNICWNSICFQNNHDIMTILTKYSKKTWLHYCIKNLLINILVLAYFSTYQFTHYLLLTSHLSLLNKWHTQSGAQIFGIETFRVFPHRVLCRDQWGVNDQTQYTI